uniref:Acrosomal protein KIAA1210-like n=1 Tax=Labrus bergylta TaxID=56723 RepID=A0A3Q3FE04_9LABR|nr:acrosomal protein KIAA1210-like [Labrus bergylta]
MSWLQALRDEFTLRPFEIEQTQSGCISMASGHQDVTTNQDPAEVMEELSGKKKSKFQMFKNFFARKKKKELPASGADVGLRASQSSENVSKASEKNTLTRSERDKGSGSKISLGSKALSHDSVFVSDSSEANEPLGASQDSIHVKVKSLQLQLKQAIRLGSPPSLMCVKKTEDTGTMSEDDGLPCSPPEYRTLHTVMVQSHSLNSLEGLDSDDDQLSCAASSRAVSPLVVPGDFSQPASSYGCLDNSAAKHKLGLRHKACYRRKPLIRLDVKADGESVVKQILNASRKLEQHVTTEVVHGDELKPQLQREDEDNEEGGQTQPLLTYKEDCDKGEDESELKHISVDMDSSPCPDPCLLVEKAPDVQPIPSDKLGLAASSLDSPRAMTPSCVREFLPDPPGIPHRAEEVKSNLSLTGEEDTDQQNSEEEVLLLEEVLDTLKTPLPSSSLGNHTEGIVVELKKGVNVKEREDGEKAQELKEERGEPVVYQADPAGSLKPDQTTTEEEDVSTLSRNTRSCQDVQSEAMLNDKEEAAEEKEEDLIVEKLSQHCPEEEGEYEEGEEVQPEEQNDMITDNRINQAQEERGVEPEESEGGEDTFKLEKSPEVEEGRRDNRKEGVEEVEVNKDTTEEDETKEDERQGSEEVTEVLPDAAVEEVEITNAMQNMDEGEDMVVEDDTVLAAQVRNKNELPLELADQAIVDEIESCVEESVIGEEREVEGDHLKPNAEVKEEDVEPNKPGSDPTEQDVEQEGVKVSTKNMMQMEHEKTEAAEQSQTFSKASFSFPEPQHETQSQESGTSTTSNTGRTMLHIHRLSPSSEETSDCKQDSEVPSCATAFPKKEPDDTVKKVKEETPLSPHDVAPPAASEEETVKKPSSGSYQTKFHFPSLSVEGAKDNLTPPSSASVCAPAAPASTEPVPALLKGNNNNPFGVWLRKTPVLHRFSSEEQNSQHSFEAPAQPYSSQTDLTQPISAKPPSNKPALPKKPDLHGDRGAKIKHISDPASTPGVSSEPDSPSWISVAIQKQKIYKDNSLNETTVKKEEPEMKNSNNSKTAESTDKEMNNPIESVDKEVRRAVSPSALMSPQPSKSQSYGLSNPVHLKPHVPVTFNKLPQSSFSAPSQVHVHQKSVPCASLPPLSNVSTYSKTPDPMGSTLISPPFSSRNAPEKSSSRASGLSNQIPSSHRFLPPPAFTQDEPPWMALAKKKAKAWSEMPQIVQ